MCLAQKQLSSWAKTSDLQLHASIRSRASKSPSAEMNEKASEWLSSGITDLLNPSQVTGQFSSAAVPSRFIYIKGLFENISVLNMYQYEFSNAFKELFSFLKIIASASACYNPHNRCGLFDFEVLCSAMCSFSVLNQNIFFAQTQRPPPDNKMLWNGCQIRNGSLSLQNSPGELKPQFQSVFVLYSENCTEG